MLSRQQDALLSVLQTKKLSNRRHNETVRRTNCYLKRNFNQENDNILEKAIKHSTLGASRDLTCLFPHVTPWETVGECSSGSVYSHRNNLVPLFPSIALKTCLSVTDIFFFASLCRWNHSVAPNVRKTMRRGPLGAGTIQQIQKKLCVTKESDE